MRWVKVNVKTTPEISTWWITVLFRHFIVFFVCTFYWLGMLIHMHYECSYHLAEKKIPSIHGQTVGFKLEQFIFDAFPYAPSTALFEVTFLPFSLIQVLQFPFLSLCWVLLLSRKICCTKFQVLREEEFAPVKNANGSNFDTPDSARLLVLRLHTRWVIAAGGFLTHSVPLYATGNFIISFMCIHMWSFIIQEYFSKIWNGKGGREDA